MGILLTLTASVTIVLALMVFRAKSQGYIDKGVLITASMAILLGFFQIAAPILSNSIEQEDAQNLAIKLEQDTVEEIIYELSMLESAIIEFIASYPYETAKDAKYGSETIPTNFYTKLPVLFDPNVSMMDFSLEYRVIFRKYLDTWLPHYYDTASVKLDPTFSEKMKLQHLLGETVKFRQELQQVSSMN